MELEPITLEQIDRTLLAACEYAETVMTLVEPRSHKAEYLDALNRLRVAILLANGAGRASDMVRTEPTYE